MRVSVPDAMVVLGRVLDLSLEAADGRTRRIELAGLWMATDAGKATLWFVPVSKKTLPLDAHDPVLRESARVFRTWFDFEPRRDWQQKIRLSGEWVLRGRVRRMAYRSDKWGGKKHEDYEHQFTRPPRLYQLGRELYRVSGPGLRVASAGIIG